MDAGFCMTQGTLKCGTCSKCQMTDMAYIKQVAEVSTTVDFSCNFMKMPLKLFKEIVLFELSFKNVWRHMAEIILGNKSHRKRMKYFQCAQLRVNSLT